MFHKPATPTESAFRIATIALGAAVFMAAGTIPARAQAFADLKSTLVDYSKADSEPRKACESLMRFKSKDIVQIMAAQVKEATPPAGAATPAHCRVTGLLSP